MSNGKKYDIDWDEWFFYDEASPSCLCWNRNIYGGSSGKSLSKRVGQPAGSKMGAGHWAVAIRDGEKRVRILAHRVIWEMLRGEIPESHVVDHINRDASDNRIENLRCVEEVYNLRNSSKKSSNKTGVTGVTISKDKHGYYYHVASWKELGGGSRSKHYSMNKYGDEGSFNLAVAYRESKIKELNEQGAGYTENHGQ